MTTKEIGSWGESVAADYLKRKRFRILERNYRSGHQEIDIIAENREYLIFVEVKTRNAPGPDTSPFGRPAAAVNYRKRQNTVACARAYLHLHPTDKQPRMDVIEVYFKQQGAQKKLLSVCHMENAYGG